MEMDERIDFDELQFHPNKLAVLWCMADFIRTAVEELIAKEKLEKFMHQHRMTDDAEVVNDDYDEVLDEALKL